MKVRNPLSKFLNKKHAGSSTRLITKKSINVDDLDEETTCISSEDLSFSDTGERVVPPLKQVRFQLDQTTVHYPQYDDDYTMISIEAQWYTEQDFEHFRRANAFAIHSARRETISNNSDNDKKHEDTEDEELSYAEVLERAYQSCRQGQLYDQPAILQQQLQYWTSRTGLEAKVIASACKGKMNRKDRLYTLVAKSQTQTHLSANELRRQCAVITRPAHLFAQQVAQAAAVVEY